MSTMTTLRKVGGSVMLAIPPVLLEQMDLEAGSSVELQLGADSSLTVKPGASSRPRYSLDELIAQCNGDFGRDEEDFAWDRMPRVGRELI